MEVTGNRLLYEARIWTAEATARLVSSDGAIGGLEALREVAWNSATCAANGGFAVVHAQEPDSMETGLLRTDGLPEGTGVPFVPGIQGTGYWEPPAVPFGSGWLLGTPQGLWESDGTEDGSFLADAIDPVVRQAILATKTPKRNLFISDPPR